MLESTSAIDCALEALSMSEKFGAGMSFSVDDSARTCVVACGEVKEEDVTADSNSSSGSGSSSSSSTFVLRAPTGGVSLMFVSKNF